MKLTIQSVNISTEKGTVKQPVDKIELNETGIKNDAHAGHWHRQISLLAQESIARAEEKATRKFEPGIFAENLTTSGVELHKTAVFDRFLSENTILEVTQIGKKCHTMCAIGQAIGDCIMPQEGIFCRVIKGGTLKAGDKLEYVPRTIHVSIITVSDRANKGIYKDLSGPKIQEMLELFFKENNRHYKISISIIPDDANEIKKSIEKNRDADIIITTGGTGIGPRDITPDIVKPLIHKEIMGIMEMIRVKYGMNKPNALLSRSIAGTINSTLVYVLPGSVKGVSEYMQEIMPTIEHSLRMLHGIDSH